MATKIADLNAMLTMDTTSFTEGSTKVAAAAKNMHNDLAKATGDTVRTGNATAKAFTQVGFAIQDFSSQIGTRGLGGAIAAVTNNLQMLGVGLGPVGLAVTSVGGAIAGIAVPALIDWILQAEKAKKKNEELAKSYEAIASGIETAAGATFKIEQTETIGGQAKAHVEAVNAAQERLNKLIAEETALRKLAGDKGMTKGMSESLDKKRLQIVEAEAAFQATIGDGQKLEANRRIVATQKAIELEKKQAENAKKEADKLADQQRKNDAEEADATRERIRIQNEAIRKYNEDQRAEHAKEVESAQEAINATRDKLAQQATSRGSQAFIGGTQESASFLNRITSGTRNEGDVLKKQLRVQEDMLKELRDNKPTPVASI